MLPLNTIKRNGNNTIVYSKMCLIKDKTGCFLLNFEDNILCIRKSENQCPNKTIPTLIEISSLLGFILLFYKRAVMIILIKCTAWSIYRYFSSFGLLHFH